MGLPPCSPAQWGAGRVGTPRRGGLSPFFRAPMLAPQNVSPPELTSGSMGPEKIQPSAPGLNVNTRNALNGRKARQPVPVFFCFSQHFFGAFCVREIWFANCHGGGLVNSLPPGLSCPACSSRGVFLNVLRQVFGHRGVSASVAHRTRCGPAPVVLTYTVRHGSPEQLTALCQQQGRTDEAVRHRLLQVVPLPITLATFRIHFVHYALHSSPKLTILSLFSSTVLSHQ